MKKTIQEIEDAIIKHKNLYYQGKAKISDEEYDQLENELEKLDPNSPVLSMVGSAPQQSKKIQHDKKMLSLEKTYDMEKLKQWVGSAEVVTMFKYDGSACSLVYEEGLLSVAKTRGDGEWGEDIKRKVIFIKDIPKRAQYLKKFEVRGEIYCTEDNFLELSKEMKKIGLEQPSSLRNIVAGILGRKDHVELARFLSFAAFDILTSEKKPSVSDKIMWLEKLKFATPEYRVCKSWENIQREIANVQRFFSEGEFLVDGLVITYNDTALEDELGTTSHHPKNKIAFKFIGESKVTKIESIEWSISRNGRCTPVGLVSPIELSGALVSRVTLHHWGLVEAFQLKRGDEIEIVRSGEVIPKFIRVVKSSNEKFSGIKKCPSCESALVTDKHWLLCKNPKCEEKNEQELLYFIKSIGIEEISQMRLKEMISKNLIKIDHGFADMFSLTVKDFLTLDKVKDKLANKFYEHIQKCKTVSLSNFIVALGIEGLAETKVQKIIDSGCYSLEDFSALKKEDLIKIDGFAERTAEAIVDGLKLKREMIRDLLSAGVRIVSAKPQKFESHKLKDKKLCITGTLSRPRDEILELIKNNAGIVQGTVNKDTNYLITNETDGSSSKFIKAKKLNVAVISEEQFYKMLKE